MIFRVFYHEGLWYLWKKKNSEAHRPQYVNNENAKIVAGNCTGRTNDLPGVLCRQFSVYLASTGGVLLHREAAGALIRPYPIKRAKWLWYQTNVSGNSERKRNQEGPKKYPLLEFNKSYWRQGLLQRTSAGQSCPRQSWKVKNILVFFFAFICCREFLEIN